jgi:hypothetical protein
MPPGTISLLEMWSDSAPVTKKSMAELNASHFTEFGRLRI